MATYIFNGECPSSIKQAFIDVYKPAPAYHTDTWYKYAGDTEWRTVSITGEINGSSIPNVIDVIALEIGSAVTSIGDYAFKSCSELTSVMIGNGLTSIGYRAFYNCYALTSVTIHSSVTSIGEAAFGWCSLLTSVTFEEKTLSQILSMTNYSTWLTDAGTNGNVTVIGTDGSIVVHQTNGPVGPIID